MTDHTARPESWETLTQWAATKTDSLADCLMELRARVERLERKQRDSEAASQVEPTDEELRLLSDDFASYGNDCRCLFDEDAVEFARAVLARWGRPVPEPVSVAERLPTQELNELDDQGTCWMFHQLNFHYCLCRPDPSVHTHWLPYWALPVPQEQADE